MKKKDVIKRFVLLHGLKKLKCALDLLYMKKYFVVGKNRFNFLILSFVNLSNKIMFRIKMKIPC